MKQSKFTDSQIMDAIKRADSVLVVSDIGPSKLRR